MNWERRLYLTFISAWLHIALLKKGERAVAKAQASEVDQPYECSEGAHRSEIGSTMCEEFNADRLKGRDGEWFHETQTASETQVRETVVAQAVNYVVKELLSLEFLDLIEAIEARDDDDELQEVYSAWRQTTKSKDALKAAEKQAELEAANV